MSARCVVYFSPVRFSSFWQRPHYMAAAMLAGPVDRMLWVDPYPTRLPRMTDVRRPSDVPRLPEARIPGVDVLSPLALPVEPLDVGQWINRHTFLRSVRNEIGAWLGGESYTIGAGKPSPLAIDALRTLGSSRRCAGRFYDVMDRYASFYRGLSSRAMAAWENQMLPLCDWVQTSSTTLRSEIALRHRSVRLCLNGIDSKAIEQARRRAGRAKPAGGNGGLVFGYIGTMGGWFDWEWTFALARVLAQIDPQAQVVLVGPMFEGPGTAIPPNVRILEPMSHAEALRTAASFDVGIIPFKFTPLTECVDPIKYYEYRGLGLPVLATAFGELRYKNDAALVLADAGADLAACARRALDLREAASAPLPLAEWTWSSRFAPLEGWLYSLGRRDNARVVDAEPAYTLS